MNDPVSLTRTQARRLAVRAQLLDAHRPASVVEVVRGLTVIQRYPYADIAPTNNDATAEYKASVDLRALRQASGAETREELADLLVAAMTDRRSEEIQRGVSLVGPHRDDITLSLGLLPAKGYASHGESWSFALALKLGSFHLLRADGIEPVLVLDDVFAELDLTRRERLAQGVSAAEQVVVTAAVGADVPEQLQGRRFLVEAGAVTPDE